MTTIKTVDDLLPAIEEERAHGNRIVTTNGCFDILHRGHVSYLERARLLGDVLVVGINSDESVRRLKGPTRPVTSAADRAYILSQLKSVDHVFIFDEDLPNDFLQKVCPDVHVKGGDYVAEKLPEYPVLKKLGAEVVIIPLVEGYSTSNILKVVKSPPGL